ncbi:MAG TPA: lytic murein transglycosylase B [Steroidobacteraceae bacterium]|nr:lytic murein transglycosylase B [Steroidobacteraceae bacterium]
MKPSRLALLAALACLPALAQTASAPAFDLKRPEIAAFIDEVAGRDGLSKKEVRALLKAAQPQPKIIDLMNRPLEKAAPWWEYRDHFVTPERIEEGVQFWNDHREALERIAGQYQVPPEYIVAILGVETKYGHVLGKYRVLDSLSTLAFDYPARQAFFRSELEQFLILAKENKLDPLTLVGSYAGAVGAPQFMPSSYRRYAVDADGDSRRDLWGDWDDIFASVGNYLREKGWTPDGPVLTDAALDPDPAFQIDPKNLELNETVASLAARGVKVDLELPPDTQAVLVSAEQRDGPAYRVGFHNFYVLSRYNASARYVMAVNDLAQAIAVRARGPAAAP